MYSYNLCSKNSDHDISLIVKLYYNPFFNRTDPRSLKGTRSIQMSVAL